jgi:hypothetical protein
MLGFGTFAEMASVMRNCRRRSDQSGDNPPDLPKHGIQGSQLLSVETVDEGADAKRVRESNACYVANINFSACHSST